MAPSRIVQNFKQNPILDHNIDKRKGCIPTINVGVIRWEVIGKWLKLRRTWCIGYLASQLSLSAEELWMIGLFYRKWPIKTRHPMYLHQCITTNGMQPPHVNLEKFSESFRKFLMGFEKFLRVFWFFVFGLWRCVFLVLLALGLTSACEQISFLNPRFLERQNESQPSVFRGERKGERKKTRKYIHGEANVCTVWQPNCRCKFYFN